MDNVGDRQTPLPYSPEDAERIRQMIATPGAKIVCPQCDEELTTGLPIAGGGTIAAVWEVRCSSCGRSLVVTDLPRKSPPDET